MTFDPVCVNLLSILQETGCVSVTIPTTMKTAVIALCFLAYVNAHRRYQHIIPNGGSVPDPCRHNHVWDAVGHFNPSTGSSHNLNPFGQVGYISFLLFLLCCIIIFLT